MITTCSSFKEDDREKILQSVNNIETWCRQAGGDGQSHALQTSWQDTSGTMHHGMDLVSQPPFPCIVFLLHQSMTTEELQNPQT